jgi:hypothetical protein
MGQKRKKLIVRKIFAKEQRRIEHYKYHLGLGSGVNITTASTLQILWHGSCEKMAQEPRQALTGTDLKVKRMLYEPKEMV